MSRIDAQTLRTFVARDWAAVREAKLRYWRERIDRGGLDEALRISDQLRAWGQANHPDWPTERDRDEDLEAHRRVAKALEATGTHGQATTPCLPQAEAVGSAPRGARRVR